MRGGQDFDVHAGDNPPVTFELRREDPTLPFESWPVLDLALLSDLEWGLSALPSAMARVPPNLLTKKLSTGGIVVDDPAQGIVRLVLATADLEREPGDYSHQLRGTFASGVRDTLAEGVVRIKHSPL